MMKKNTLLWVLLLVIIVACYVCIRVFVTHTNTHTFTLLHFNDLHSRLLPFDADTGGTCTFASVSCVGGITRMKTLLDQERALSVNTLTLSSGDTFQGSVFFNLYKEDFAAEILNVLAIDVMSLGNHEFDYGDAALAHFVDTTVFPVLQGNITLSSSSPLYEKLSAPYIIEMDDIKIGVISALTTHTRALSSPSESVSFKDEITYLTEAAQQLTDLGVPFIIALTHVGYEKDKELAKKVPHLDVIVGGHSDTFLSNTDPQAEGPYPTWQSNEQTGANVAIVQTAPYGAYVGKLRIELDGDGNTRHIEGEPLLVHSDLIQNEAVLSYVHSLEEKAAPHIETEVGFTETAIEGTTCREEECELGNLMTNAMLYAEKETYPEAIALLNSGSIRASIDAGTVTKGDIITALPFEDTFSVSTVDGKTVRSMLERSVEQERMGSGAYLQVGNLTFSYDRKRPNGNKICEIIHTSTGLFLDDNTLYTVVTPTYLAYGGDGYTPLKVETTRSRTTSLVLQDYFESDQYKAPHIGGRISPQCN